jgi:O-acetyl-ADP-ribose deacetylase (regulator of RNase III)
MAQLVRRWSVIGRGPVRAFELHLTPDIVSLPPGSSSSSSSRRSFALVNSANERLQGTQFTTSEAAAAFPNTSIIYPEQTVDGLVYELSGGEMQAALAALPTLDADGTRCVAGAAVMFSLAHGSSPLGQNFQHVVHAVAPLHGAEGWASTLGRCYWSALDLVWQASSSVEEEDKPAVAAVILPLLGAGAKGVPVAEATRIAAVHCASWQPQNIESDGQNLELMFGVHDDEVAEHFELALDAALSGGAGIERAAMASDGVISLAS